MRLLHYVRKFRLVARKYRIPFGISRLNNLLLVLLILCLGCADIDFQSIENNLESPPDVELFGASIFFSTAGEMQLKITAPHISRYQRTDQLILDGGIRAQHYNAEGRPTDWLTAQSGEVFERERRIMAYGNVILHSDSGMVLYADTLIYNPKIDKVTSDGFVIIVTPTDSISGYGLKAATDLSTWQIHNTSGATWREIE